MIEPYCTMQQIWLVYTVHQTLPFVACRSGSGSQDYSGTHADTLKTILLVLISEVSLFQGENNISMYS